MREKLEALCERLESGDKTALSDYVEGVNDQMKIDARSIRAILASAPTDGALSASELEVAVHRNMEVPSIREAVVQAAIQWYCADDDFIDVRSEWLEKAVRALPEFTGDDLSPPSSWPTNEAESEAETKRALAPNEQVQVRVEPHGPAPAANTEGLRERVIDLFEEAYRLGVSHGVNGSVFTPPEQHPIAEARADAALRATGEGKDTGEDVDRSLT